MALKFEMNQYLLQNPAYVLFVYNNKFIQNFVAKNTIKRVNIMYKLRRVIWGIN